MQSQKLPNQTNRNFRNFSPKEGNFQRTIDLNNIYSLGNISEYYGINKHGNDQGNHSNIFLYYSPKNININNARIRNIYSPQGRAISLRKSSSQNNIYLNRPMSCAPKRESSFYNFTYEKTPIYSKKKIHYNLEKEKLYQETYQIRKMVNILNKKLCKIKLENLKRDDQINRRQKKINDIIILNDESTLKEKINLKNNDNFNRNNPNNIGNDNNSYYNDFSVNSSLNVNNNNCDDVPIYSNFYLNTSKKSGTYQLLKKIKKSINEINDEIVLERMKYEELKKSLFLTKLNEFNIETTLLEEQINKINNFIQRDILIQEENIKKKDNNMNLQLNIERQEKIIKSLNERSNYLDNEEKKLQSKLNEMKKKLESKTKIISINKEKIKVLIKKNNDLSKNPEIKMKSNKEKIPNKNSIKNPKELKNYYTNELSKLNKIIKFYSTQCEFSEKEIAKLKEQQTKVLENNKRLIKPITSDYDEYINLNKPNSDNVTDNEKISNLRKALKESNKEKSFLKKKLEVYQNKLDELEKQINEDDFYNKSQIEFGIDEKNPFCADDNNNNPEKTGKFTSAQFNQFTYILFKNFESRNISYEESNDKVIKFLLEFNKNNNIINNDEEINYQSDKFNLIVEGYSKIILDILNRNNDYNFTLTKIFIKALFYNSEYDIKKLIEYFKVLFSYTKNHSKEEEKYINKLRTKYKKLVEKLISCIKAYLSKEKNKNAKYIHLLKVKNILENKEIFLKDKYIEFIFYYMKKFEDPEAKLGDLKISLLQDLIQSSENEYEFENSEIITNNKEENNLNNDINIDINKKEKKEKDKIINKKQNEKKEPIEIKLEKNEDKNNKILNADISIKEDDIKINNIEEEDKKKEDTKKEEKKNLDKKDLFNQELIASQLKNEKKSITEENLTPKMKNIPSEFNNQRNNVGMDKENTDDMEEDEDSMTEITNEEYVKQLKEAIKQIKEGLTKAKTNFNDLMNNVVQKRKLNGKFYEYVTIEDFNDQLKSIKLTLSDLKLSCLCSKYSIPNELRLVDKNRINDDIQKYINGNLKLEEEENL